MMTNKLYELEKQARNYADSVPAAMYERRIWTNHFQSKYAELIIQECIEVVLSSDPSPKMIAHEPYRTIMNNIVEHFGIE